MARLFVAVPVSEKHKTALNKLTASLDGALQSKVKWTQSENWHVTLLFIGNVEDETVDTIRTALRSVSGSPFSMQMGKSSCVPSARNPRVLWMPMSKGGEECVQLSKQVDDALPFLGIQRKKEFVPHLTLGRIKKQERDDFTAMCAAHSVKLPPLNVDRFELWESTLTAEGPIYALVEEYLLQS